MRWLGGLVVGVAAPLLLGACTGEDRSPAPGSADAPSAESPEAFAPADVSFLTNMVGHHRQAAELAETALGRTAGPQLGELAATIAAAHDERLDEIRSLLSQADAQTSGGQGAGDEGGRLPGTVTDAELQALGGLRGEQFDRRFTDLVIRHQEAAVDAAERVIEDGDSPAVAELAAQVIDAGQADIARMSAVQQQAGPPLGAVAPGGLGPGQRAPQVFELERRLDALRYDVGQLDDVYDARTAYAVTAFQKVSGLPTSGRAGQETVDRLATAQTPAPLMPDGGATRVEIDLPRQVLFVYKDGDLVKILPISSGSGERYCNEGDCGIAVTPAGAFRVTWRYPGWRKSDLGRLYKPVYFHDRAGIAVHGYPSVPEYPASHGCVRIPMFTADWFYQQVPRHTPVYVLDGKTPVAPIPPAPGQ